MLAVKQMLRNKKQAVMLTIIIAGVTFSAVSVLISHYNINVNNSAFVDTVVGYATDVVVRLNDADDGAAFKERMTGRPDVYSIFGRELVSLGVDDNFVDVMVVEDFALHTGFSLSSGRRPLLDSEIALRTTVLSVLEKT